MILRKVTNNHGDALAWLYAERSRPTTLLEAMYVCPVPRCSDYQPGAELVTNFVDCNDKVLGTFDFRHRLFEFRIPALDPKDSLEISHIRLCFQL